MEGHHMIAEVEGGSPGLGARRTGSNAHTCYLRGLGQFPEPRRVLGPESVKQG